MNSKSATSEEYWASAYGRNLEPCELEEISRNVTGLFTMLDRWDKHLKGECVQYCEYCKKEPVLEIHVDGYYTQPMPNKIEAKVIR